MRRFAQLFAVAGVLAASAAVGDIIYLKDGTKLEGDVRKNDDGWIVYLANGTTTTVSPDKVQSMELKSGATGPQVAAERLASLRRSVENLADLKEIISRYQRFIDSNKDPAALDGAKKDLAIWQDRADQQMVKVGTKWIPAADRAKLAEQAAALADQARQLLKQGRTKEAEPILLEATGDDPQNPSALYLLALLRYQQDKIPDARKSLDAVNTLVPNHAPTLNNLAVIQWRQKQFVAAMGNYAAAMLAAPVNKDILDNVASALQSLPQEFRNSTLTLKAVRVFQEQDKALGEQMAQQGWHRYGSTWVTDKDMDQIRQKEKENQDKLDAMSAEFDKTKDQVDKIDRDISDTETSMHRIEASSYSRDPNTGTFISLPYPQAYYDLQADDKRMRADRAKQVAKMDSLKQTAQTLLQRPPAPKTADVQKVIGPEGTPILIVDAPTTGPVTTQPG